MGTIDWIEVAKIALPFFGGLGGVWLGSLLTLRRFKSERIIERQIAAIADVGQALSEMDRVIFMWIRELTREAEYPKEYSDDLEARYKAARRQFETTSAVASLLLPKHVNEALVAMDRQLNVGRGVDQFDSLSADGIKIQETLDVLVAYSQKHFRG
jgi:hypothetical protein